MTRYKLKQVKQTDEIEQRIRQKVQQQISQPKRQRNFLIPILTIVVSTALIFLLIQLLTPIDTRHNTASKPTLMNIFHEIEGDGVTYNQNYMAFDMQHIRTLKYYKEVPYTEFLQKTNVSTIDIPTPFQVKDGNVIAVNDGYFTELQFHFPHEEEFINISMSRTYFEPIDYDTLAATPADAYGTPIELERLNPSTTLVKKFLEGNGGLVYTYYSYDEENNSVHLTATTANEFYTIADGYIYYIGFSENSSLSKTQMTEFVKTFIEHNEFKTLEFEQATYEASWLTRGGKTMLICLVIAIVSLVGVPLLIQKRSQKVQKMVWSLVWIVIQTPILTWLIGFSVGTLYRDGFAAIGMMLITFPSLLILGILIIIFANKNRITWLVILHVLTFVFAFSTSIWNEIGHNTENDAAMYDFPVPNSTELDSTKTISHE
ncbi:hypothetical protein LZ480_11750 [Solibacillus sp. MA9]|uniref:DUF1189 domain-containing protein n=1 Tax=Solibacillus palustris TaxID=2908203 RepID=A0ABS9UE13_9BACL|nr:hypothetical protein [Solibacillus sp. MA9]MCH7322567.1 hypothetical protein [Solibacillus sp. MA9]